MQKSSLLQRHYYPPLLEEPSSPHTMLSLAWDGPCERFGLYLYFCLWLWGTETGPMPNKAVVAYHQQGQHTEVTVGVLN